MTGDFHVPLGATTFVALLEASTGTIGAEEGSTCLDLARVEGGWWSAPPPTRVLTHGGEMGVVGGWCGVGTLALPGFQSPSCAAAPPLTRGARTKST